MESACLDISKGVESHPLERHHYNLQKFSGPSDHGYQAVENIIVSLVTGARKYIRKVAGGDFTVTFSLSSVSDLEYFVGREAELMEIHRVLNGDGSRRIAVLHGLGGIGKTQLSVAYAKCYNDSYSAVFWLNIKDEDSVKQSFVRIAKQIPQAHPSISRLKDVDAGENLDEIVDAVKAWLSLAGNTRWLIIYDNYDNPKVPGIKDSTAIDIRKFLPQAYQGSIIITTRSPNIGLGRPIKISKLVDVSDSLQILANASRREGLKNGKISKAFGATALIVVLDPNAIELATELDGLPLALATAGAYLDQVAISFSDYLRLYTESWARLQKSTPELSSYEDRTLYSTWQISYQYVQQQNDLSAKLLCFWAYFDSQDLWLELLQHSNSDDPDWVQELAQDELHFHETVRVLSNYGLVEVNTSSSELVGSRGYSMHRCVHSWTVHVLNQTWDYNLARLAVKFVGSHIPDEQTPRPWVTQRRLLQHAMRCSYLLLNSLVANDNISWDCLKLSLLYYNQDKLVEAEQMSQRALEGYEKARGPEHMSTLKTVNNLGVLYYDQGKLFEAEQMYQRALEGYEKAWGPEHMSTLKTINNLGLLYKAQGKLVEAEQMYQRALEGKEKAWGLEHTSTLDTVNNLGTLYKAQGKLVEAEQMYQRALEGYEKTLGTNNVITYIPALNIIWNLGCLFEFQADIKKAKVLFSKASTGYEKVFGPDHPETQTSRDKLRSLDAIIESRETLAANSPMKTLRRNVLSERTKEAIPKSKRYKLLRKLCIR
jgi:tetratricopeptide (TPR) repeat protein